MTGDVVTDLPYPVLAVFGSAKFADLYKTIADGIGSLNRFDGNAVYLLI